MADPVLCVYKAAVLALNAKVVVELGTGQGTSTHAFIEALKLTGGKLYSVDRYPGYDDVRPTIEALKDEPTVIFVTGHSPDVGMSWNKGDIDILLCDSDHSHSHVTAELNAWSQHSPKIIFIHDMVDSKSVLADPYYASVEWARSHKKQFFHLVKNNPGLGAII